MTTDNHANSEPNGMRNNSLTLFPRPSLRRTCATAGVTRVRACLALHTSHARAPLSPRISHRTALQPQDVSISHCCTPAEPLRR
jgi:hypothetical protein